MTDNFRGYPTHEQTVDVAGRTFTLICPADADALIEQPDVVERFENDEYLPYWSQLWSSSLPLAKSVTAWGPAPVPPPAVLEIGCGLGLVSLTLAALGYDVTASDYDDDALAFVQENARRNDLPIPDVVSIDWRRSYPDRRFDRILAADVLYETRALRPVAEFIAAQLNPGGFALVADPHRSTADDFEVVAKHCDLSVQIAPVECPSPDSNRPSRGRIFTLKPKPASA